MNVQLLHTSWKVGHAVTNPAEMEMNAAYSAVNRESVAGTAEYEEIDDGQTAINGETDMFNISVNTAYQTRTEAAEAIVQAEEFMQCQSQRMLSSVKNGLINGDMHEVWH